MEKDFAKALLKHHIITSNLNTTLKNAKIKKQIKKQADDELINLNDTTGGGFMDWLKSLFSSFGSKENSNAQYAGQNGFKKWKEDTQKNHKQMFGYF